MLYLTWILVQAKDHCGDHQFTTYIGHKKVANLDAQLHTKKFISAPLAPLLLSSYILPAEASLCLLYLIDPSSWIRSIYTNYQSLYWTIGLIYLTSVVITLLGPFWFNVKLICRYISSFVMYLCVSMHKDSIYNAYNTSVLLFKWVAPSCVLCVFSKSVERPKSSSNGLVPELKWIRFDSWKMNDDSVLLLKIY
jgi:hypothetical protein